METRQMLLLQKKSIGKIFEMIKIRDWRDLLTSCSQVIGNPYLDRNEKGEVLSLHFAFPIEFAVVA
jgi:hypothetical protein